MQSIDSKPIDLTVEDGSDKTELSILQSAHELAALASGWWDDIYTESDIDRKFIGGQQWDDDIRQQRIEEGRPCLTVNQLTQYTERVLGDMRQNKACIKVRAVDPYLGGAKVQSIKNADQQYTMAQVYESIVKEIEYKSNAQQWYERAAVHQVQGGIGWLRVYPGYASDNGFEVELKIKGLLDPTTVLMDYSGKEPDFSDANYCFVFDRITKDEFSKRYPDAAADSMPTETTNFRAQWVDDDLIVVAEYFTRVPCKHTIYQFDNGAIVSSKDKPDGWKIEDELVNMRARLVNQREVTTWKVMWRKISGNDILEGGKDGIELPFSRIPVVPMLGREIVTDTGRMFESLVRHARDPQREANYWRTAATEMVALQPKAPFIATDKQIENNKEDWDNANKSNISVLTYVPDPQAPPPQRAQPTTFAAAEMQNYLTAVNDMKACMGMYDASVGNVGREESGRAILARERQSDIGTFVFTNNRNAAISAIGKLIVEAIPTIYDQCCVVKMHLEDESDDYVKINQEVAGSVIGSVSDGEYEVQVDTAPNYNTQRIELVNSMMEIGKINPDMFAMISDLVYRNMDFTGASELADRVKRVLMATQPHLFTPAEREDFEQEQSKGAQQQEPSPEEQMAMQQAQMQMEELQLELEKARADAAKAQAHAEKAIAEAQSFNNEDAIRSMVAKAIADFQQGR